MHSGDARARAAHMQITSKELHHCVARLACGSSNRRVCSFSGLDIRRCDPGLGIIVAALAWANHGSCGSGHEIEGLDCGVGREQKIGNAHVARPAASSASSRMSCWSADDAGAAGGAAAACAALPTPVRFVFVAGGESGATLQQRWEKTIYHTIGPPHVPGLLAPRRCRRQLAPAPELAPSSKMK